MPIRLGGGKGASPTPRSQIKPSGVADLLVVKQQIKRYEAGEIANIANILRGETNNNLVRQTKTTELTTTTETEQIDEEQRDLQTTEHFELKNEIDKTIKQDASVKAGVALSGSYGGTIDFKTYVDGAYNFSQEESTKHADAYSKDVTSRSASRVTTRTLQRVTRQVTEQFLQETNHGFNNVGANDHMVGIYQWIDKIYEAQVFNYGKRLLFDFMVPEPAAYFMSVLTTSVEEGKDLHRPDDFTLTPDDITDQPGQPGSYYDLVAKYGVTGVDPPPPTYQSISKAYSETSDSNHPKVKSQDGIPVPPGYKAISATVLADWAYQDGGGYNGDAFLHVFVAGTWIDPGSSSTATLAGDVEGNISVGLFAYKVTDYTVTIDILCQATDAKRAEWKLKTHAAIYQAWIRQLADYQDKLAALMANSAGSIQGHNPAMNLSIVKNELKRSVMALLTERKYESYNAIDPGLDPIDQPATAEVPIEGKFIRFFEQAFEWDQILYVFYPYFWARTSEWHKHLTADDIDPQFADFLRAGWARVTLPVRPWFEDAVAHYIETGAIWEGGDIPPIHSPLYVSILTEIEEHLQKPGSEEPQGTPWEVRLPTQLVRVRKGRELPLWQKDQQTGKWIPQMLDENGNWVPET